MLRINEKQQQAILLLAEGRTSEETANILNVTPKKISIWRLILSLEPF